MAKPKKQGIPIATSGVLQDDGSLVVLIPAEMVKHLDAKKLDVLFVTQLGRVLQVSAEKPALSIPSALVSEFIPLADLGHA